MTAGEWLQTNDIVELQGDGSFTWLGRWDNVINSGGVKIQVEMVEAQAEAIQAQRPDLAWAGRRLAIAGIADPRLGEAVTLVLSGPPMTQEQEDAIQAALRPALERFALPRRFAYLPALPATPTGKIDRRALAALLGAEPHTAKD